MNGKSLFEWNRQYAPTGEEAAVGRWIASQLGQYNLSPEIDPFGTVLVRPCLKKRESRAKSTK